MTRIKICGVTLPDDAARVAAAGVDFIGLNFWPKSKRYLDPARAPMIADVARGSGRAKLVGVFVDPTVDEILAIAARAPLDVIQLHGDESPELCAKIAAALYRPVWKALAVSTSRDVEHLEVWQVEAIVLDTPTPGRGAKLDWNLAREARERHPTRDLVLAGGLDPGNVGEAIAAVEPWAVDVASGVEAAPGIKDPDKLAAFVAAVHLYSR